MQITLALRTWLLVLVIGALAGFAIVGAEAVFLRVLPTTMHLLLAVGVGIAAAALSVALKLRSIRTMSSSG